MGRDTFVVKPALRGLTKNEAEDVLFSFDSYFVLMPTLTNIRRMQRNRKKCGVGFDEQVSDTVEKALYRVKALAKKAKSSHKKL